MKDGGQQGVEETLSDEQVRVGLSEEIFAQGPESDGTNLPQMGLHLSRDPRQGDRVFRKERESQCL